ncbi:hypothetical protein F4804DRAFT_15632 [Jackrogersella minutella]|nr:hypothetical protein F4804DRAFT_15632 [Jackrogersella minutella]
MLDNLKLQTTMINLGRMGDYVDERQIVPTMESFIPLSSVVQVHFREAKALLFCAQCRSPLFNIERSVDTHIQLCFTDLSSHQRQSILGQLRQDNALLPRPEPSFPSWFNSFRFSKPIEPIPTLQTTTKFGCAHCSYAAKDKSKVQQHQKTEHPFMMKIQPIPCPAQSIQFNRGSVRHFRVTQHTLVSSEGVSSTLSRHLRGRSLASEPHIATSPVARHEPNMFLEKLGFTVPLSGRDLRSTVELIRSEDDGDGVGVAVSRFEAHLSSICYASRDILCQCQSQDQVLKELNRRQYFEPATNHFTFDIEDRTINRYVKTWRHVAALACSVMHWAGDEEPPCHVSEDQRQALARLLELDWDCSSSRQKDVVVMDVVWALSSERITRNPMVAVIPCTCAILCVDSRTFGCKSEETYDHVHFSAIINVFLFVVYYRAVTMLDSQKSVPPFPWTGFDVQTPPYDGDLPAVSDMLRDVMYVGGLSSRATPITWTVASQGVASALRRSRERQPNVEWVAPEVLSFASTAITISRDDMAKMMQQAVGDVREQIAALMFEDTASAGLLEDVIPSLGEISDDRSNATSGYSFLDHVANRRWAEKAKLHLIEKLESTPSLHRRWWGGNSIDRAEAKRYLLAARTFKVHLALATHLTTGQPCRRPEQQTVRWRNTFGGGLRNVFVLNGRVAMRTVWSKRCWTSAHEAPIWKFLPPSLGRTVVAYLGVVVPFLTAVSAALGNDGMPSPFLYSREPLSSPLADADLLDTDSLFTKPLKSLSDKTVGIPLNIATYRRVAIAFSHHFMRGSAISTVLGLAYGEEASCSFLSDQEEAVSDASDNQANHSTEVARRVYAVEASSVERYDLFFQSSARWHVLFGLDEPPRGKKRPSPGDDAENLEETQQEIRVASLPDLIDDNTFRAMMKNGSVSLDAEQRSFFHATRQHTRILWVKPTGGGKSVAFALPAFVQPDTCFVVIQPTLALLDDTYRSLHRKGVSAVIWTPAASCAGSSVVLVTPESLSRREWRGFIARSRSHFRIDAVVLDEAHKILLASPSWRPSIENIQDCMDMISPRQIYLTGTLPVGMVAEFESKVGARPGGGQPLKIIRTDTVRPNLQYEYAEWTDQSALPNLVSTMIRGASREGRKAILFCESRDACEIYGAELGIPVYHAGRTDEERRQAIREWEERGGGMSATTALPVGIDYPDISVAICLGSFDIITLGQQFGRAGRDGLPAIVLLLAVATRLPPSLCGFAEARCKRSFMSQVFDGKVNSCGPSTNACWSCAADWANLARPATRLLGSLGSSAASLPALPTTTATPSTPRVLGSMTTPATAVSATAATSSPSTVPLSSMNTSATAAPITPMPSTSSFAAIFPPAPASASDLRQLALQSVALERSFQRGMGRRSDMSA